MPSFLADINDFPVFTAKDASDLAKSEAEKAGQALDNTKNTINSSVQQANAVASNAKSAASNIADASQRVRFPIFQSNIPISLYINGKLNREIVGCHGCCRPDQEGCQRSHK